MHDLRLDGKHLEPQRVERYDAAVADLLDNRGVATVRADEWLRPPAVPFHYVPRDPPVLSGVYTLVDSSLGRTYPLRVGVNALGRCEENDLVFPHQFVSRRHCVVLVHATGFCEVYDTASLNGVWVDGVRVERAPLQPGSALHLGGVTLFLACPTATEVMPSHSCTIATPSPETCVAS